MDWMNPDYALKALNVAGLTADTLPRSMRGPAIRDALPDGTPYGEPEGMIHKPSEFASLHGSLEILAKDIAEVLMKRYPGFLWAIQPDERGAVINILILNFHDQWGYTIRIADVQDDPKRREAIKAGAELLRRFRYPGERYDTATANGLPRDFAGRVIPDITDMQRSKQRDKADIQLALAEGRTRTHVSADGEVILEIVK